MDKLKENKMEKEQIINEIDELLEEGNRVLATKWDYSGTNVIDFSTYVDKNSYISWRSKIITFFKMFLSDDNEYFKTIDAISGNYFTNAKICISTLNNVKDYIIKGYLLNYNEKKSADNILKLLFERFHKVARQLRNRYNSRETLSIEDEYDTQDLLHSLLQLYFDDIRAEEWTPSYAGGCARMDFLLKNEKTVIEVKKTRASVKS